MRWVNHYLKLNINTIRTRLLLTFMLTVSLPATIISLSTAVWGYQDDQTEVINKLELVAHLKQAQINTWTDSLQTNLSVMVNVEASLQIAQAVIPGPGTSTRYNEVYSQIQHHFQYHIDQAGLFGEIFLLNRAGEVVLSTNTSREGQNQALEAYFTEGLQGTYLTPPFYDPRLEQWSVIVARPLLDNRGQTVAVLAGRASLAPLNEIMQQRTGLGETGETYLVNADYTLLTESRFPEVEVDQVRTEGTETAIEQATSGTGFYEDYRGVPIIGAYRWLPELQMVLLAEQDQAEAFRPIYTTLALNLTIALVSVLLTVIISLYIIQSIANPLTDLAETVTQIAAGDINRQVDVERHDEIGNVAEAFNSMTQQFRELIDHLEQRVADRTKRLEIVAALGERLTAILNLEQLLVELVNQVKNRFGYYYVHVYLVDANRQNLVMTAGSGEIGHQIKAQQPQIPLEATTSLIAQAARTGEVVRRDDVQQMTDWSANPLLPDTRSDMVVPIILEGQVVGVLEVQDDKVAGFDDSDAALLRSLANQVAVAIRNARLFADVEAMLNEAQAIQEKYTSQAWHKVRRMPHRGQYDYHPSDRSKPQEEVVQQLAEAALQRDQPAFVSLNDDSPAQIVSPIRFREAVVGTLQLHSPPDRLIWSEDDLLVIEAVVDQLGQMAENLRLFEETRERAAQEQTVREIAERMQTATDLAELTKIVADELGQRLSLAYVGVELGLEDKNQKFPE